MTDLSKNHSGPKENDNRDKSLHGLIVALAMAGTIAGSVILFAYASSDGPLPNETASTVNELEQQPDPGPVIVEKVVDEPMFAEKIDYVNGTTGVEKLVYTNIKTEAEKEVPAYAEKEPAYTNEIEDEPQPSTPVQSDEQEEKDDDLPDESELDDIIQKRLLGLLDEIVDFDEDEKEYKDDDGNKGKGHKHEDDG